VYTRGQFALLGAWPKWMLVALILAAAVGLALLIRSRFRQAAPIMQGWRAWVIWGLETLLVAVLLVLLWQPAITVAELKPQQNIIAVLVDDSRSMAISEDGSTRQAQAVKALQNGVLASLSRSFQTRLYRFDDVPARIDSLKDLRPNAPSTRIGDSLKQLSEETSDLPIGAVVLLSDGTVVAEGPPASLGGSDAEHARITFTLPPGVALADLPVPAIRKEGSVVIETAQPVAELHRLTGWAVRHDVMLSGLTVDRPSLEDVYLRLTRDAAPPIAADRSPR